MNLEQFYACEFSEHEAVTKATAIGVREPFKQLVEACVASLEVGGKLMFFGNGGSAADAQHLATELTVRYKTDRAAIAALALTTDTSALTAIANTARSRHKRLHFAFSPIEYFLSPRYQNP